MLSQGNSLLIFSREGFQLVIKFQENGNAGKKRVTAKSA
jgi:hypothetical protein